MVEDIDYEKKAREAVLFKSETIDSEIVKGYDFNEGIDYDKMFKMYKNMGFQSSNMGRAIDIINNMINYRLSDDKIADDETDYYMKEEVRKNTRCTIFLGYTSNLISSGLREILRYLCEHKMVDCIVTTAGGIEEDFIKCLAPTYMGEFTLKGADLRPRGINRIGNLLVPNENYCMFEDWMTPQLDKMLEKQKNEGFEWTPSSMIKFLGEQINNKESVYYWAAKNDIPVFCPAITDGSIGDMLFFHNFTNPGLKLDIVQDIVRINKIALSAKKSGMILLGGGLIKHHINNANMMRNGADYAVYLNTGHEFDGSDAGARPDEAISWGKIKYIFY